MNTKTPVVCVVDDDQDVLHSLDRLLRASGLAVLTFGAAQEFLEQCHAHSGCILLDVQMPKLSGIDLQAELSARNIQTPIVFLTGHGDIPTSVRAMKNGAADFLTKPYRAKDLLAAIHSAIEKDRQRREAEDEKEIIRGRMAALTQREADVFRLVIAGMLNKQIGGELGICERTVKVHRARVMRKMQVASVAELTRLAERCRLEASQFAATPAAVEQDCPKVS